MNHRLLLPLVGVVALLLATVPTHAQTVAAPSVKQGNQGLQYGAVIDNAGHILLQDEALRLMAQAGAGWIKINFRLGGFQNWTETSTFGYSALSLYDQIVASARRRNLKVLGELSNEAWNGMYTHWQGNNAETVVNGTGDNQYIRDFSQNAAVLLAQHYAGQIDAWEVWNEPSQTATYMYPSNFAQLLAHVFTKTKAAGVTNVRFVSGGITALQDSSGNITADSVGANYLREVYNQGKLVAGWNTIKTTYGSYPLDSIGQHIYLDGFGRTSSAKMSTALQLLRGAYVEGEGSTAKQTVITEFGWATNNVSEQTQASNLQTAYTTYKQAAYVERAYWFFTRDEPTPRLYFGLLRSNSSQKPAWKSYQTYATY
jgi:hypothetical protein